MKNIKLMWIACLIACCNFFPLNSFAQEFDDLNDQADKEYAANKYQSAMDLATRAIAVKSNARSYLIRADCYFSLKKYETAINLADAAAEAKPKNIPAAIENLLKKYKCLSFFLLLFY